MSSAIEQGRRASVTLAQVTQELNEKLAFIEDQLVNLSLGVSVSVDLPTDKFDEFLALSFKKHGPIWGLFIEDGQSGIIAVKHASRDLRLKVADQLGTLVDELLKKSAAETAEVQERVSKLDALIASMQSPSNEDVPF